MAEFGNQVDSIVEKPWIEERIWVLHLHLRTPLSKSSLKFRLEKKASFFPSKKAP